jgi:carnosine N-methyltransferase
MAILQSGLQSFGFSPVVKDTDPWYGTATASDFEKARSTLRQFYRDWSLEGESERIACYGPIIEDLLTEYYLLKPPSMNVLVPGAGLGRLVFELCKMGFNVEGNEISYHQLLASSYILNHCPSENHHTIYPWVHGFSNHSSRSQHLQPVLIPDIHPGTELQDAAPLRVYPVASDRDCTLPGEMSMSASDFLSLYGDAAHKSTYDAVATVFFLDTAPNPIRYIETIKNCLRPGGIWTNLGPLLWHFENNPPGSHSIGGDDSRDTSTIGEKPAANGQSAGIADPGNVELTDDEIVALVEHFGFKIEKRESRISAGYIQDPKSMLQSTYKVSHWVARKL